MDGLMVVGTRRHNADDIVATALAVEPMKFVYRGRFVFDGSLLHYKHRQYNNGTVMYNMIFETVTLNLESLVFLQLTENRVKTTTFTLKCCVDLLR